MNKNIVTAPLALLVETSLPSIIANVAPGAPPGGRMTQSYFNIATLITLIMIGGGIYLLVAGTPGDLEIAGKGLTIRTKTAGLALLVLGLLFYLGIGKLILTRAKD